MNHRRFEQRDGQKLLVPYVKCSTLTFRSFSVMGPRLWNNIPNELRSELILDAFKRKLKTFLFRKAYNADSDFIY